MAARETGTNRGSTPATRASDLDERTLRRLLDVSDVERLSHGLGHLHRPDAGLGHIVDEHPRHRPVSAVRQHDRPPVEEPVPEGLLAVERLSRPMHERRPEGHRRKARVRVHPEEHPLGAGLVLHVRVGEVVRSQGTVLAKVQAGQIRGDARHEHVALQLLTGGASRGLDVARRGPRPPVVGQIEDGVEAALCEETGNRRADLRGSPGCSAPADPGCGSRVGAAPIPRDPGRRAVRRCAGP